MGRFVGIGHCLRGVNGFVVLFISPTYWINGRREGNMQAPRDNCENNEILDRAVLGSNEPRELQVKSKGTRCKNRGASDKHL